MISRITSRFPILALIADILLLATTTAHGGGYGFGGFGGGMGGGRIMNQLYRGGSSHNGSSSHRYSGPKYSSSKPYTPSNVQPVPSTQVYKYNTTGSKVQDVSKGTKLNPSRVVNNPTGDNNTPTNNNAKKVDVGSVTTRARDLLKNGSVVASGAAAPSFPVKPGTIKIDPSKLGKNDVERVLQSKPDLGRVLDPGQLGAVVGGILPRPKPVPGQVLDPGIGNGNPGPIGPINPPSNPHPPICGTHPSPTKPSDPHWNWVGVTLPVLVAVHDHHAPYRPTVINNTTVIQQPVVQVPVVASEPTVPETAAPAAPDLQLVGVALFEQGSVATATGPTYRIVIRNGGSVNVGSLFTVTVVAAKADRSFDGTTPRTDEPVISLAAGQEKTLDVRLPVEALTCEQDENGNESPFATLLVVIDGYAKLAEASRDNNAAAIARSEIQAILPIVASAEAIVESGNREVNVAGQSFGVEQGKLLLDLGSVRVPAEVVEWGSSAIRAKLPQIETAAGVTTRLVVVRADGTAAEPFDLSETEVAAK